MADKDSVPGTITTAGLEAAAQITSHGIARARMALERYQRMDHHLTLVKQLVNQHRNHL